VIVLGRDAKYGRIVRVKPQRFEYVFGNKCVVIGESGSLSTLQLFRPLEQLIESLRTIRLEKRELDQLLAVIEEERGKEHVADGGVKSALENALESCARNLDSLTKLRYRELIRDDEFIRQRAGLNQEQIKLQQKLAQLDTAQWIAPSQKLFLFSNRAVFWLSHGNPSEKRLVLSTVGSHLSLRSKKLSIDAKKPFQVLQGRGRFSTLWTIVNDVRTFFRAEPDYEIPLLPQPDLEQIATE
jgi:hypothetical protein